jgi:hypothetical protein
MSYTSCPHRLGSARVGVGASWGRRELGSARVGVGASWGQRELGSARVGGRCKGRHPPTPDVRVSSPVVRAPAADGQAGGAWEGAQL